MSIELQPRLSMRRNLGFDKATGLSVDGGVVGGPGTVLLDPIENALRIQEPRE